MCTPIGTLNTDRISQVHVFKKSQMGIAMPADDAVAARAGRRRSLLVAGAEGERAAARARQDEERHAVCRRFQPRHRPGIGPRPRPRRDLTGQGALPGALDQHLRELRLEIDVAALSEVDRPGDRQDEGGGEI
jgi:hypothetical protein